MTARNHQIGGDDRPSSRPHLRVIPFPDTREMVAVLQVQGRQVLWTRVKSGDLQRWLMGEA